MAEVTGLTAWDAFLRLSQLPRLLFLDSSAPGPLGRYSYLMADPFAWQESNQGDANPFPILQGRLNQYRVEPVPGLPPFQGGAAGMFGYDLAHYIEKAAAARYRRFSNS